MRLMCPNCDAEYEVDASAIPLSGRDVQCSNCGHAWFQHHPELEADQEAESALYDPPPPLSKMGMTESILPSDLDWQVESDDPEAILDAMGRDDGSAAPQGAAADSDRADESDFETAAPAKSDPPPPEDPAPENPAPAAKREIDPEAMRILREEVELETAQRALEQGQAAQDAAANAAVTPVTARRVARLKGIQPPPLPPNPEPQAASPSARLPKVDTVSAALRTDDLSAPPLNPQPKSGRGGTLTMLFLAFAATAAYVFSPDLSARLPSIAQPLAQYVGFVDGLRDQLDILLPKVIAQGQALIALVKGWF